MKKQVKNYPTLKFKGERLVSDGVLKAKISSAAVGLAPKIAFNHRHVAKINTGVEVEIDQGYMLCVKLVSRLAEKGMVLTNAPGNFTSGKVEVVLLNAGREIVEVLDGDPIVDYWVEPIQNYEEVFEKI